MSLVRPPFVIADSGSTDTDGHRTWNRTYRLYFSHAATAHEAMLAAGMPRWRSGHPTDPRAFCSNLSPRSVGKYNKTGVRYDVDVEWSTRQKSEPFPWLEAPVWAGDNQEEPMPFDADFITGAAVVNSAGRRFLPGKETKQSRRVWRITRNQLTVDEGLLDSYRYTVNSGTWNGYDAKHALFLPATIQQTSCVIEDLEHPFFVVGYTIIIAPVEPWNPHKILDEGFAYKTPAGKLIERNADGSQITEPVALKDGLLWTYNDPQFVEFAEWEEKGFDALDLVMPPGITV